MQKQEFEHLTTVQQSDRARRQGSGQLRGDRQTPSASAHDEDTGRGRDMADGAEPGGGTSGADHLLSVVCCCCEQTAPATAHVNVTLSHVTLSHKHPLPVVIAHYIQHAASCQKV